jgi:hypothetical protein
LRLKSFLNRAFNPTLESLNIDAVITLCGLSVWTIVTLGAAFHLCDFVPSVSEIGTMLFGVGIGRATKAEKKGD